MSGWIKYHRKALKHPLFKKPTIWHYFQYCLLKAAHDKNKIVWNKKEMVIERGSFITGRIQAATDTGLSEQNIRTAIKTLVNLKMIEISTTKSTSKFTYISICNYNDYQIRDLLPNQQPNHEVTSNQPASNQQVTTNKNVKKVKELKNEKKETKPLVTPQEFFDLWNQYAVNGITRARKLTRSRVDKIKLRIKEEPDLNYWVQLFSKLQKMSFYCGHNKDKWSINIDYMIKNDTVHVNLNEQTTKSSTSQKSYVDQEFDKIMQERQNGT